MAAEEERYALLMKSKRLSRHVRESDTASIGWMLQQGWLLIGTDSDVLGLPHVPEQSNPRRQVDEGED